MSTHHPLRVLYISNQKELYGGAERSLYELLEYIDRNKVSPYFASVHDSTFYHKIKSLHLPVVQLNEFRKANPLPYMLSLVKLVAFIRSQKIQIIHNNQCGDVFYSWLPGRLTGVPIIIHHRDSSLGKLDPFFIRNVDANICISTWQRDLFLNDEAVLIHNGIVLDKFCVQSSKEDRKRYLGSDGSLLVGLVGRITRIKGQHVLIRAAELILKSYPLTKFLIVGSANSDTDKLYLQQLRKSIASKGMGNAVSILEDVEDARSIISSLDISVVPSLREPFGRVIIESMALKKPVISTNAGGAIDIINKDTGLIVPPGDSVALADAIILLIKNPITRKQMGLSGSRRVKELFTVEHTLGKIYALYERILSRSLIRN